MIAKHCNWPLPNEQSPKPLGYIAFYCMKEEFPLLSVLAVGQITGNPEATFYEGYLDIRGWNKDAASEMTGWEKILMLQQLEKVLEGRPRSNQERVSRVQKKISRSRSRQLHRSLRFPSGRGN